MKKIGTATYMHRDYLTKKEVKDILPISLYHYICKNLIGESFDVIKYDSKTNKCSLITCEDWEGQREPIIFKTQMLEVVGGVWCQTRFTSYEKANKPIYHHKWMFVPKGYSDFNIEQSKAWSEQWEQHVKKGDKRKVGYLEGWHDFLRKNNLPME